jgi:hypothetical protein
VPAESSGPTWVGSSREVSRRRQRRRRRAPGKTFSCLWSRRRGHDALVVRGGACVLKIYQIPSNRPLERHCLARGMGH